MIISHKNKFIFIKTEKTAGTSIEIALSKYCGPEDIITPISPEDEIKRKHLGYRRAQNYSIPFTCYSKRDFWQAMQQGKRLSFFNHAGAAYIGKHIDKNIWDSYYKFCVERNPWDKVVSWYYWRYKTEPRPPITDFVHSKEANIIKGFNLYTSSSEIVVDKVFLFEKLDQAMKKISHQLGLGEVLSLPKAKSGFRKDKRSYRDILSDKDREKIGKVYAREIAYFDYRW